MARKRMIDPGIWDSVQAMSLTPAQFKLYIYLISAADDDGRLKCCPELMRSRIYPFNDYTQDCFNNDLARLSEIGLVEHYLANDTDYLYHPNWLRYQKINHPTPSILPAPNPEEDSGSPTVGLREDSLLIKDSISKVNISKTVVAQDVTLTEEEHAKLVEKYGADMAQRLIDTLSSAKLAKGYKYKSDYHAILTWVVEKCKAEPLARAGPKGWKCPHCGAANTHTGSQCLSCKEDRDEEVKK